MTRHILPVVDTERWLACQSFSQLYNIGLTINGEGTISFWRRASAEDHPEIYVLPPNLPTAEALTSILALMRHNSLTR